MLSPFFRNTVIDAPTIFVILMIITVIAAAIFDAKTFTIPNIFPFIVVGLFIFATLLSGLTVSGWGWHILSAAIAFIVGFALFVLNIMGGGDVKLFAAIALWVTPTGLLPLTFFVTTIGTLLGLLILGRKLFLEHRDANDNSSLKTLYKKVRDVRMPYGPAIALGTVLYVSLSS